MEGIVVSKDGASPRARSTRKRIIVLSLAAFSPDLKNTCLVERRIICIRNFLSMIPLGAFCLPNLLAPDYRVADGERWTPHVL